MSTTKNNFWLLTCHSPEIGSTMTVSHRYLQDGKVVWELIKSGIKSNILSKKIFCEDIFHRLCRTSSLVSRKEREKYFLFEKLKLYGTSLELFETLWNTFENYLRYLGNYFETSCEARKQHLKKNQAEILENSSSEYWKFFPSCLWNCKLGNLKTQPELLRSGNRF
jgi:hypothetical protein